MIVLGVSSTKMGMKEMDLKVLLDIQNKRKAWNRPCWNFTFSKYRGSILRLIPEECYIMEAKVKECFQVSSVK